ncbi:dolichol kinase [Armigeres subalbatus]|uniref:dolichol kinase n=1 Tax=Armigeres subalbatus TaxID=124917 RepID=UPI002ED4A707
MTKKCATEKSVRNFGITTRPHANDGLWLSGVLFLCQAVNVWNRDNHGTSLDYKRSTILSFGLALQTVWIFISLRTRRFQRPTGKLLYSCTSIGTTSFLLWVCLKDNVVFVSVSAVLGITLYNWIYFKMLKQLPKSFTLGEAAVVGQGVTIFAYYAFLQLPRAALDSGPSVNQDVMHLVLQIILTGIGTIITLCHILPFLRNTVWFYLITIVIASGTALFPIFGKPTILLLFQFILSDTNRMLVIALYMSLLILTSFFVVYQINGQTNANTATRKIFHIAIVLVFLPGLWSQCTLLHLASGLMLGLLLMLETARVIHLEPIHSSLDTAVRNFIDEKDAGPVALTPIYLLVGCSLPMWLHPVPCDLTDSAGRNLPKLLAGVLSVGIGDTMASVCGYLVGRHKWPGTNKSVEGTLASIVSQAGTMFLLYWLGFIHLNTLRAATTGAAIIINALVEAKTSQVDNLVLPMVTYIVLGTA